MALHVMEEANRCLGCKNPRCREGCPIHTNIPEVIRLLKAVRGPLHPGHQEHARALLHH